MKHINLEDLPRLTEDEFGEGETIAVERDGEVIGYFMPVKKRDAKKIREAMEAFDRMVEYTRAVASVSTDEVLKWVTLREQNGSGEHE